MAEQQRMISIPCVIAVSRETGKVIGVERTLVREDEMSGICGGIFCQMVQDEIRKIRKKREEAEGVRAWAEATE